MSVTLSKVELKDKISGCWLGKNIGSTLGEAYEGKKKQFSLTFYDPFPEKSSPNDDLDLQLVWLQMLEEKGVDFTLSDLAKYWKKYLVSYPWNEYGFCQVNLRSGLLPPVSGCFNNYFVDEMGSPIRSEIWACIAPAHPQLAAEFAWKDAVLDHAGGEGVYGEMFWAALQSAAFVLSDPRELIGIGLNMIPVHSLISRAVREAVWCSDHDLSWQEARERIVRIYGHHKPCNAPQNHAFTILGWLYGTDFGDRLCAAVNCGYDTDCTGATLGATLGILDGASSIPQKWLAPVGTEVVLHKLTGPINAPANVEELTDRTLRITETLLDKFGYASLGDRTAVPETDALMLPDNRRALEILQNDTQCTIFEGNKWDVHFHYCGEPAVEQAKIKPIEISLRQNGRNITDRAEIELRLPEGWRILDTGKGAWGKRWTLLPEKVSESMTVGFSVLTDSEKIEKKVVFLDKASVQYYGSGDTLPQCSGGCGANTFACLCDSK